MPRSDVKDEGGATDLVVVIVTNMRRKLAEMAPPSPATLGRSLSAVRRFLPRGRTLPHGAWRQRHRTLTALLVLHALALPAFGIVQGYEIGHTTLEGLALAAVAGLAIVFRGRPRLSSVLVSFGLVSSSALLVHLSGGVIEAHFHFFVVIVLLALYEDWVPFLVAATYVAFHHGVLGTLDPASVYNHPGAIAHPWKWAAIHAGFVAAAGIAAVATWRLNEAVRAETREAYRKAHESEQRFKGAFSQAPIGMALASVAPESPGRFLHVNAALSELLGYTQAELTSMSFREITHPDDLEASSSTLTALVSGKVASADLEKRYVRSDGQIVWGLVHVSLVRDDAGDPLYTIAQIQDVTERKAAREQLARQALHDQLTDLSNRRKLQADLDAFFAGDGGDEGHLMLFDLDGFKAYNDTFGHPAGDALLTRLGRRLEKAVEGRGHAYRMGGDEFCVLTRAGSDSSELAERAVAALTESGEGFAITASFGWVLLPTEASDPVEALGKADQRMYGQKTMGRQSAQDQITRVLVTVLDEHSSLLRLRLAAVAKLCEAVGEKLGLTATEMISLRQAASLYDIGKIAIPEAILSKPGSLTSDEWEFVRSHTLIGERIVGAASALGNAAKLIRSSHERFDGSGYPDRLAGEEIPLGARIIAVCDAYCAMSTERPYREALTPEAALEELRRCAGTQFDPVVVDAFCAVEPALRSGQADEEAASAA